ncbi:hypothetical protein CU097_012033 [Rhizopus azygosporus]|uniref:Polysaccharide lyase 14 domain-containing protein n=1 Tax=Rhizopus azygosporus TaxID=86630 RepID=A0A367KFN9_RHIAZ|nr:hypothetical protein CU097_012033 [Rhizopus azygosporus]
MHHQHLITKTLLLCYLLIIVVQAKSIKKSWSFKNWNKYKDSSVGQGSNWSRSWGISEDNGWLWMWNGADSVKHVIKKDPSRRSSDMTLRVEYPAHSRNPDSNPVGGLGFKAKPIKIDTNVKKVELSYSVYFPKQFNFVKGGKLPGLYGGHGDCTGGEDDKTCFTTRLMWRKKGEGEIYAYLPYSSEPASICGGDLNVCNPEYGYSLGRGSFRFKAGKWTHLRQVLTMNTPGKQDGQLVLYANGKKVFTQQKMIFRREPAGRVVGIMFHTFFGGSDDSWETPRKQYSYYKNFALKTTY